MCFITRTKQFNVASFRTFTLLVEEYSRDRSMTASLKAGALLA